MTYRCLGCGEKKHSSHYHWCIRDGKEYRVKRCYGCLVKRQQEYRNRVKEEETAGFLDAPGFVRWLEEEFPESFNARVSNSTFSRAILRWRKESKTLSIFTADHFLTEMGLHISLIPDDLFVANPDRTGHPRPRERA